MIEHPDYVIRTWLIECSVDSNKKNAKAEKIISDAQKYYGFLFPEKGKVESLKQNENK